MHSKARQVFRILSEETLIPLSVCIGLAGGIVWLTTIAVQTAGNAEAISSLEKEQKQRDAELNQKINRIAEDVGYIRGVLDRGKNASSQSGRNHDIQN